MRKKDIKKKIKERKFQAEDVGTQTFTAFIIKGNRQVVRREIAASKRFRVDDDMYIIKPECIFLKNIDGFLRSVSYYREGNPNPYSFITENMGLSANELDRLYSEDFYHIVTNLQGESKMTYVLFIVLINLVFAILMTVRILIGAF